MKNNLDVNYELNRIKEQTNCLVEEINRLKLKIKVLENIIDKGGLHQASKNEELIFMSELLSYADYHSDTVHDFCDKIEGKLNDEKRASNDDSD